MPKARKPKAAIPGPQVPDKGTRSTPKPGVRKSAIPNPQSEIRNPQSAIRNPQSGNPQSGNPQSPIRNPQSDIPHLCHRIKQLRTERGWSLEALSQACSVSRSMISQIERNQANPTLAVTFRIAQAFGISLGDLVEAPRATSSIDVIRAEDRSFHYRSDQDCRIRTLSPLHLEKDVEFYEVQLNEGGALRSAPHFQGTREFLTVQKGRIRVESGHDAEELAHGDSASYRADVPHAIINAGKGEALIFLVDIYR